MRQASIRTGTCVIFVRLMALSLSSETHAQRTQAASVTRGVFLCEEYRSGLNG
jgi:hypothetical protein